MPSGSGSVAAGTRPGMPRPRTVPARRAAALAPLLWTVLLAGAGGMQAQEPPTAAPPVPIAPPIAPQVAPQLAPQTPGPDPLSPGIVPVPARPGTPWLDEVRAQRQAREARRQSAREAFEARRRLTDPRGAAHQDAWEEEVRRRREARMQRIEQDRERFRGLGPPPPWPEPQGGGAAPPPALLPDRPTGDTASRDGTSPGGAPRYPPGTPAPGTYVPPDWDNLWYYRGY